MDESAIQSDTLDTPSGFERRLWFLPARKQESRSLCVFLDAEYYLERLEAPAMVSRLQHTGRIPPIDCVFVSNRDNAARHRDYTCDPDYAAFIVHDVLGWARERRGGALPQTLILCGLSLSGLCAASITLSHPGLFSGVVCQSGSFWWNDEWLAAQIPESPPGRFWISVGAGELEAGVSHAPSGMRQDVSQLAACERFAARLRAQSAVVRLEVFEGGHAIEPWSTELPRALAWALGLDDPS